MDVLIYSYTRQQAIADGVLHDLTELARETGFLVPVAVTDSVWRRCIEVPAAVPWQDQTGRAWDLLAVLFFAIKCGPSRSGLMFEIAVQNESQRIEDIRLKAIIGPGDDGEPVITVMFPEED